MKEKNVNMEVSFPLDSPGFSDPKPADLAEAGILLVLQRVVFAQDSNLLVGVQSAVHDAAKDVETGAVLGGKQLGGVDHQGALQGGIKTGHRQHSPSRFFSGNVHSSPKIECGCPHEGVIENGQARSPRTLCSVPVLVSKQVTAKIHRHGSLVTVSMSTCSCA